MIERRTFLKSLIGLLTTSLASRGNASVPVHSAIALPGEHGVAANSGSVLYTIQGWDVAGLSAAESEGRQVVPIYLPASWRSSWM